MDWRWKWVVLWSLWAARLVRQPTLPVRVTGGLIRGGIENDGSHAYYLNVPYATMRHRFQAAEPVQNWDGIIDLHDENVRCTQRYIGGMISGREDCLTLNIYTPLQQSTTLRPVMVFIHGGGFRDGSGSRLLYGPEYLIRHDIILVTVNYRLEILGFLCLGIKEAPGNIGLKDQVEALKWVQRNIQAFGGDPDNVTIFGESAGAASVVYHLISPMSKGLFHKAVMQSGSAISPWAFQFDPLKTASKMAKQMGYNTEDPKEIYKIFINKSAEELLMTRIPRADGDIVLSETIFVPCLEKEIPGVDRFLIDIPYNLLAGGKYQKVPIIIGYNSAEGYMFAGKENDTTLSRITFSNALPRDLMFPSEEEKNATAEKLKDMYIDDEAFSKDSLEKIAKYEGDTGITFPVLKTAELFLETSNKPIYMYKFSHEGWMNLIKLHYGFWNAPGATHADELFYIFKTRITLIMSFFETDMTNRMTTMWTNFAKFSNPTPEVTPFCPNEWPAANKTNQQVLVIDKKFSETTLWEDDESISFWKIIYSKFRRKK